MTSAQVTQHPQSVNHRLTLAASESVGHGLAEQVVGKGEEKEKWLMDG